MKLTTQLGEYQNTKVTFTLHVVNNYEYKLKVQFQNRKKQGLIQTTSETILTDDLDYDYY